jgi:hypothetical protein
MGISVIGGAGPAAGSGTGSGSGAGKGTGTGTGAGSGAGKSPFSGITVIGGGAGTGVVSISPAPPRTPRPLQTAYGLSIISTENSGGGLPSFGVFSNEQIYTVYLDMRSTEYDPPQSWTLEFAVGQTAAPGGAGSMRTQEGVILPFPSAKEQPPFPVDLLRKYLRRMMIVYALVNTSGKLEQITVKDSPDPALSEILVISLAKWVFRPAQLNGQLAPAKVLMGIPLALP